MLWMLGKRKTFDFKRKTWNIKPDKREYLNPYLWDSVLDNRFYSYENIKSSYDKLVKVYWEGILWVFENNYPKDITHIGTKILFYYLFYKDKLSTFDLYWETKVIYDKLVPMLIRFRVNWVELWPEKMREIVKFLLAKNKNKNNL